VKTIAKTDTEIGKIILHNLVSALPILFSLKMFDATMYPPGTDVMILKIFLPKKIAYWRF
jgi:hypothetical protein